VGAEVVTAIAPLSGEFGPPSIGVLRIAYQPIVDLRDGGTLGFEALARFETDPARPAEAWFRDGGTVLELRAAELACYGAPCTTVWINVSAATLCSAELAQLLERVAPGRVVLELTEHDAVEDYAVVAECSARLRARGIRLAIDDVGSQYAGLDRVVRLRPDVVKIDRDLIAGIDRDPVRRAIVAAIASLTIRMGGLVVAEGVECEAELETARALGVHGAQGYLLGLPAPLTPVAGSTPIRPAAFEAMAAVGDEVVVEAAQGGQVPVGRRSALGVVDLAVVDLQPGPAPPAGAHAAVAVALEDGRLELGRQVAAVMGHPGDVHAPVGQELHEGAGQDGPDGLLHRHRAG
jgi:EAL domain-containing protein (putative c-di-GMP-specific phosphodiesterase class I)